jgi:glutamyl-Q tRNA(Asp) synthetase
VRIEDLDTSRVIPGCADQMLRTLEAFGLHWDGPVEYQRQRVPLYLESLETLRSLGLTFECSCSRRDLDQSETGGPSGAYPGTCRAGPTRSCGSTATRYLVGDTVVSFQDRVQGRCQFDLRQLGDPVIRRRDGIFAYQLAVVVDDGEQGVSDVVRGADLLQSTAWQIELQRALHLAKTRYAHLPLVMEDNNKKLSKSRRSLAIDAASANKQLFEALCLLKHPPPVELARASPGELLAWATTNWDVDTVQGTKEIVVFAQISHV